MTRWIVRPKIPCSARAKRSHAIAAVRNPDCVHFQIRSPAQARDPSGVWAVLLVKKMSGRGPNAKVVELPVIGHAPTLMHSDQIEIVRDFLLN